jgi:hypothetical protein
VASATLLAQNNLRRLTTIDALRQFPRYYHLQNVVLRGEFAEHDSRLVLQSDTAQLALLNPTESKKGPVEVRGQLIDVGRLESEDARLADYVKRRGGAAWPSPGAELVLNVTGVVEVQAAATPTVRNVALEPWKFEGQAVTISGSFRGRNLFADLPDAPGKGRYDFVLGGAEGAAVWVVGLRPRGRDFDLDIDRKSDTSRWLQVTGVVGRARGLITVTATSMTLAQPPAPALALEPDASAQLPLEPAVPIFSAPTADETDVPTTVVVRVQLSRGVREGSLAGHLRVTYVGAGSSEPIQFTTTYTVALNALQIAFRRPLEPFRTVKVELLDGITAFDGAPVTPWSVTFTVGGR